MVPPLPWTQISWRAKMKFTKGENGLAPFLVYNYLGSRPPPPPPPLLEWNRIYRCWATLPCSLPLLRAPGPHAPTKPNQPHSPVGTSPFLAGALPMARALCARGPHPLSIALEFSGSKAATATPCIRHEAFLAKVVCVGWDAPPSPPPTQPLTAPTNRISSQQ